MLTRDQLRDVEGTARMIENAANTLVVSALSDQISGGQLPLQTSYIEQQIAIIEVGLATLRRLVNDANYTSITGRTLR